MASRCSLTGTALSTPWWTPPSPSPTGRGRCTSHPVGSSRRSSSTCRWTGGTQCGTLEGGAGYPTRCEKYMSYINSFNRLILSFKGKKAYPICMAIVGDGDLLFFKKTFFSVWHIRPLHLWGRAEARNVSQGKVHFWRLFHFLPSCKTPIFLQDKVGGKVPVPDRVHP